MLSESALPVSTIATDCGFDIISHFNRRFLAKVGMKPSVYRKGLWQAHSGVSIAR